MESLLLKRPLLDPVAMSMSLSRLNKIQSMAVIAVSVLSASLQCWAQPNGAANELFSDSAPAGASGSPQAAWPFAIQSVESADGLGGKVEALSDFPFATVKEMLDNPEKWCEVMLLHLNNQSCQVDAQDQVPRIHLQIMRKGGRVSERTYPLQLEWTLRESARDRFEVALTAAEGPLGTRDYRISLVARPAGKDQTMIGLSYSSKLTPSAHLALRAYLGTVAAKKFGFTQLPAADGKRRFISGMRGLAERTAVRYYLAVEASLQASRELPAFRTQKRFELWFDSTEQYRLQLHEIDRDVYLASRNGQRAIR
ncbi:MAG: hypothetical protein Q7T87_12605 [Polaromonas sp.]|nr:hypothetical protein [Polaromonas sp.]